MSDGVHVLAGGEVLVSGAAVLWVATALERAVQSQRSNGVRGGALDGLAASFATAAARIHASVPGSAEVPIEADLSSSMPVDPVTASEAANMLDKTTRTVTGLCNAGAFDSAVQVGGRWLIERADVLTRVERTAS